MRRPRRIGSVCFNVTPCAVTTKLEKFAFAVSSCGFAAGPLSVTVPSICEVASVEPGENSATALATSTPESVSLACVW